MRRVLPLLALAGLAAAAPAVEAAKPPRSTVTIAATPTTVVFGRAVALAGTVSGGKQVSGQTVTVQADAFPFGDGYVSVASATTDATGAWHATTTPARLTRYRAVAHTSPPARSATDATVAVRLRVTVRLSDATPAAGTRVRFSGHAYPAHDGAPVAIQRRSSTGRWVTVARTTLLDDGTARSRYSRRVRIRRSGTYRVRASSGDQDHLRGYSRKRRITVH
jgi:hypothetical protein